MPWPGGCGAMRPLCALLVVLIAATCAWALAAGTKIEKIEVRGLRRMTVDAFIFASGLKVGQDLDPEEVRRAFRRLWDRGLFSDLKAEVEEGETGKIVIFTATERPVIVSVDYEQVRAITRSNIEDRFKERNVDLAVGKPLDRRLIHRAEDTIRDLLGEKGYLDAAVRAQIDSPSEFSSAVRFKIQQGPRTRIKKIRFVGNKAFSERKLKGAMRLTKEHSWLASIAGKDIYFPLKYDQDIEKVRDLYQNAGYLDVDIKPPQVDIRPKKDRGKQEGQTGAPEPSGATQVGPQQPSAVSPPAVPPAAAVAPPPGETDKQRVKRERREEKRRKAAIKRAEKAGRKWVYLTVRVHEGPQYRLGEIKTTGNTIFTDKQVLDTFQRLPLRSGDILNRGVLDAGVDVLRARYGEKGYLYASIGRNVEKKEGNVADVTIDVREDRAYYIDRIEFEGNTTTRDEVLRREMRLNEGDLLNKRKLDLSVYKLNQLSYNVPAEEPIIEPVPGTDRARVRVRTEERGRNEITVGGGYSGVEGFFFQGSFSTRNFLGRGQSLGVSWQLGGRITRYVLAFTEPYFLGRPVELGFRVFNQDVLFAQNATRSGSGGSIVLGRRFGDFWSASVGYSFESIRFTDRGLSLTTGSVPGTTVTNTSVGSINPSISHNTINNLFRPTRGSLFQFSSTIAGRYLGGDNSFYKPDFQATRYVPLTRRTYFGLHGAVGLVSPYGQGATFGGQVLGIPRFERFFLGGEYLGPRVFETRSISPIRFVNRDGTEIARSVSDIITFEGRDVFGHRIEKSCREEFDFTPNDGRCANGLRQALIGGDRYFLSQLEYDISTSGPFVFGLFLDAGNVLAEDQGWGFDGIRVSTGIETRIYLPVFGAPLRFIYGFPLKKQPFDTTTSFQFSIGSSF